MSAAQRQHVFGYGSLAATAGTVCALPGFRRCWGVAMDNAVDLPGYRHYRDPDGTRPALSIAFLDLAADPAASVNGVCFAVDDDELLALDARERNYDRLDVSGAIPGVAGPICTYVGSAAGRRRLTEARSAGRAVVSGAYVDAVRAAFDALGPGQLATFDRTSDLADLARRELIRVDPPATGA